MEKTRHVLLITYYWPPAGGAGVHRWLRFSKYFKENGWQLHVYCPEDAAWPTQDSKLLDEVSSDIKVVRRKILEPHKWLGKKNNPNVGAGLTRKKKGSVIQKLIIWTRGNLFIPDSRFLWVRPSVRFLKGYLADHPEIEAVISTGPPHSMHLIAQELKKSNALKWIADFRDPWTEIDFYQDLLPGKWADAKHKRMEKSVLKEADKVVTVSQSCADGLSRIGKREVEIITNGFEFPEFNPASIDIGKHFEIAHFGSMPEARNPKVLWKALKVLCAKNEEFREKLKIKLVGPVDFTILLDIEKSGLKQYLEHIPQVPHHESIFMQRKTPVLLLVANNTGNVKGILTGKVFEYFGAKRPILAIGQKDSDLEKVIEHTQSGAFIDYADLERTKEILSDYFKKFNENQLICEAQHLQEYSSPSLSKKIIALLD